MAIDTPSIVNIKVAMHHLRNSMLLDPKQIAVAKEWLAQNNANKMKKGTYIINGEEFILPFSVLQSEEGNLYGLYLGVKHGSALGRGQYGTVRLTQNLTTGEWAAIKTQKYSKQLINSDNIELSKKELARKKKIKREIAIKKDADQFLGHQKLKTNDISYDHKEIIIMPLYSGEEYEKLYLKQNKLIFELLENKEPLNKERLGLVFEKCSYSITAAKTLFEKLHYLHEKGIIHRDLHAGNILIDEQGNVIIIDLGCAVKVTDIKSCSYVVGRVDILSPEATIARQMVYTNNEGEIIYDIEDLKTGIRGPNARPIVVKELQNSIHKTQFLSLEDQLKHQYTFKDDIYAAGFAIQKFKTERLLRKYGNDLLGIPKNELKECLILIDKLHRLDPKERPFTKEMVASLTIIDAFVKKQKDKLDELNLEEENIKINSVFVNDVAGSDINEDQNYHECKKTYDEDGYGMYEAGKSDEEQDQMQAKIISAYVENDAPFSQFNDEKIYKAALSLECEKRLKEAEAQFSREELSVKKTSTSSRKKESKDKLEFYPFPSDLMKHVAKFVNDGDHKNLAKLLQLSSSQYQLDMTAWKAKPTELGTIFCFLETAKEKASHTSDYESLKKQIEIFKSHTEKLSAGHRIYDIEKEKYPKDFRIFHNAVERTKKALLEKDLPAIKEGIRGLYINHKASEKKENPEIMASETQNIALHKPFTNG